MPIGSTSDLYNGIAANAAAVWATNWTTAKLARVDPVTLKVVQIAAGLAPKGVLATADGVWVADTHDGSVLPVDLDTNKVGKGIMVGPAAASGPNWLASGLGSLWVGVPNNNSIVRVNPGARDRGLDHVAGRHVAVRRSRRRNGCCLDHELLGLHHDGTH